MTWLAITGALVALGVGIWLGLGAPGWPHKKEPGAPRRRLEKRNINPIAWTRRDSAKRGRRDRRRR